MPRAQRLATVRARAARDEVEANATLLALGGHLSLHEKPNPLCHRGSPRRYGFLSLRSAIVLIFACVQTTIVAQLLWPDCWNCGGVPDP